MKHLSVALIALFSIHGFASEELFQALNVEAVKLSSSGLTEKSVKSVGGVSCTKISSYTDGKKFECEFDFKALDSEKIYKSLKASERSLAAPRIELKYEKAVGSLSCVKTSKIQSGVEFNCKLKTVSVKASAEPRE